MPKNSIRDYSATAASNTDIQSVDIDENCAASGINNALREIMADLKDVSTGTVALETPSADQLNVDNITIDGNTISSTDTNGNVNIDPDGTGDVIVASGNLGVSVTSADAKIDVVGSDTIDSNANTAARFRASTASGNDAGVIIGSEAGVTPFIGTDGGNAGAVSLAFRTENAERMRIDSSGNVGIGTSSPSELLHVDNASGDAAIRIDGSTRSFKIEQNNYGLRFVDVDAGNAERMRIAASGNVGIGYTSPASKLNVNGTVYFNKTGTGNFTSGFEWEGNNGALVLYRNSGVTMLVGRSNNGEAIRFNRGTSDVGSIDLGTSSTSYNTSSDHRLKENVADMTGAIDRVKALAPKRFNFIADADTTVDGFLAHEAQAVVPEAVTGTKDAMRDEQYEVTPAVLDDDGNVVTEAVMGTRSVPDYQGIDQSKLVPLLTGALQEAIAKIETLETEMTALKARVTALEA